MADTKRRRIRFKRLQRRYYKRYKKLMAMSKHGGAKPIVHPGNHLWVKDRTG